MSHKTWVEVSAGALTHNLTQFRGIVTPEAKLMSVVKSNAYGHGLAEVARIADQAGADWFGVDSIDEAVHLRKAGIGKPTLILGYTVPNRLAEVVSHDLSQVLYDKGIALKLSQEAERLGMPAKVHLKIETGTWRQGLTRDKALELFAALRDMPGIEVEGAYTHYANIEDSTDHYSYADSQLAAFRDTLSALGKRGFRGLAHTGSSAATILYPETHFDMVRLGISQYGLWPSEATHVTAKELHRNSLDLRPALTWKTVIAQVKDAPAGSAISYGCTEKLTRASRLAVLPVGYWDGYDRGLSSVGIVLIRGKRAKILGRVCMNMVMADATDIPGASAGDEVVLLGRQEDDEIPAEDMAAKLGTINYEVVTRINPLIARVVTD